MRCEPGFSQGVASNTCPSVAAAGVKNTVTTLAPKSYRENTAKSSGCPAAMNVGRNASMICRDGAAAATPSPKSLDSHVFMGGPFVDGWNLDNAIVKRSGPPAHPLIDAILVLFAVVAIAGAMSVGGPALDEFDALKDAQESAERRDRFERGAQAMCGENAAWSELPTGEVQCFTKRGHKTIKVTL